MSQESYWERGSRWYYCEIGQDLFNNWTVRRIWGDKISRRCGHKEHLCQSFEQAEQVYQYVIKRRRGHRYHQTGQHSS